jgi:hypothetical protein
VTPGQAIDLIEQKSFWTAFNANLAIVEAEWCFVVDLKTLH